MKFLLSIAFIISSFSVSYACTCAISATEQGQIKDMENMETIFFGKVISVGKEQSATKEQGVKSEVNGEVFYRDETIRQIKFEVLRIWKGTPVKEIIVGANAHDFCSFLDVKPGDKLLLFTDNHKVLTSLSYVYHCSTVKIDRTLLKKVYGEGETVKSQNLQQNKISEFILSTVRRFIFLPA